MTVPQRRVAAAPRSRGSAANRSPARNYLAPGDRRRLFWLVMPAGLLLLLGPGWISRSWSARRAGAITAVDTRLAAVRGPAPRGDEVVIEPAAAHRDANDVDRRGASLDALSRVRDATTFRAADNDAWFEVWTTLRGEGPEPGPAGTPADVSFRELFGQPRSFRGRLVRMRGVLRRAELLRSPPNDYGIDRYWQCWMKPDDGPPAPVVVQCLSLPAGVAGGMSMDEPVEVTGYFFKNLAYSASDAIRVAPVIMTTEPVRLPAAPPAARGVAAPGGVALVVAASLAAIAVAAWAGSRAAGGHRAEVRPGRPPVLDASLAGFEPVPIEESLRRLADAHAAGDRPDTETG